MQARSGQRIAINKFASLNDTAKNMAMKRTGIPAVVYEVRGAELTKIMPFNQPAFQVRVLSKHFQSKSPILVIYYQIDDFFLARADPTTSPTLRSKYQFAFGRKIGRQQSLTMSLVEFGRGKLGCRPYLTVLPIFDLGFRVNFDRPGHTCQPRRSNCHCLRFLFFPEE